MRRNWKSLVAVVVALQVLGFVWYAPLFGERWMALEGLSDEQVAAAGWFPIVVATLASIALWWVLSALLPAVGARSAKAGSMWGLQMGVAFGFLPHWMNHLFGQRPLEYTLIVGGFVVLMFVVTGAIVGAGAKAPAT